MGLRLEPDSLDLLPSVFLPGEWEVMCIQLLYTVVLISAVPWGEPAVCTITSPPRASLPLPHPVPLGHRGAQAALLVSCTTVRRLSVSRRVVLTGQSQARSPPPLGPDVRCLCLCLCSCPGNRFICIIFLDSILLFLFLTYFTLYDRLKLCIRGDWSTKEASL